MRPVPALAPARFAALAVAVLLVAGLITAVTVPTQAAPAIAGTSAGAVGTADDEQVFAAWNRKTPDHYTPPEGVKFNRPLGTPGQRREVIRHLLRSINSVPKKGQIRIASWNVRSDAIINALIQAHIRRKVSVQVVMDRLNANPSNPNTGINRLQRALKVKNGKRPKEMRSKVVKCVSACRAQRGIAHTKFYLFSKVGRAKNVVMYGSYNATDLAGYAQWNDLYTIRRNRAIYDEFAHVFKQMTRDRAVKQPFLSYTHGNFSEAFYPFKGKQTNYDPILRELGKVRCQGASGPGTTNGRTRIRIAQTSMHGARGIEIATKLREMYNNGCDIKIVYAVFGNEVMAIFRNKGPGELPFVQIAQDFNLDGVYDRYLHMKSMTIQGHYDGVPNAQVVINGSANWTGVALASDEVVGKIVGDRKLTNQYASYFDFLFRNPPRYSREDALAVAQMKSLAASTGVPIDPYANMKKWGL